MPEIYSLVLSEKSGSICIFFYVKIKAQKVLSLQNRG